MKLKTPSEEYIEKAKHLTREDAERILARIRGKLLRRLDDRKHIPLEAVALQLEIEDEQLQEWRERLAELRAKHKDSPDTLRSRVKPERNSGKWSKLV